MWTELLLMPLCNIISERINYNHYFEECDLLLEQYQIMYPSSLVCSKRNKLKNSHSLSCLINMLLIQDYTCYIVPSSTFKFDWIGGTNKVKA